MLPEVPHHVVLRGNNRRRLFSVPDEYEMFIFFLALAERRYACRIHAVTLMTNHIHLVITPPHADALGKFVKAFAQRYAQARNDKRDSSGKLFEERYFSVPILSDYQLGVVTAYVHANPIRARIVEDALEYPWSTHAHHANQPGMSRIPDALWTPSSWYLELGSTRAVRATAYLAAFDDYRLRGVEPEQVREVELAELLSSMPYELRLRRPDGSRAG